MTGSPGSTTAVIRWRAPRDRGVPTLSGYTVRLTDPANGRTRLFHVGAAAVIDVAGLTPGDHYSASVAAVNTAGSSSWGTGAFETTPPPLAVTATQRRGEVAVPSRPAAYRGPLRSTRADGRSFHGIPAFAADSLDGYRLKPHQAVALGANLFAYNSGTLSARGRATLRGVAGELAGVHAVTCEVYTDYQVDPTHARQLSRQRASAVCTALAADGLRVRRVAVGYGGQWPVTIGGTIRQRHANRRVILVTS